MQTNVNDAKKFAITISKEHADEISLSRLIDQVPKQGAEIEIVVSAGVQAKLVDDFEFVGVDAVQLTFCIHRNASLILRMRSVQRYKRLSTQGDTQHVIPASRSDFTHDSPVPVSSSMKRSLVIQLLGQQSVADVRYACLGTQKKVFTFDILQEHKAEQATSNVSVRSVLEDESRLTCKGMIHIHAGAQRTNAELENKNIVLGATARAVSIPMLEIEANDVVCKHGAAVSKLDKEHFFYLQSRGIDVNTARTMLIDSFLH